jgi:hypothetical protein
MPGFLTALWRASQLPGEDLKTDANLRVRVVHVLLQFRDDCGSHVEQVLVGGVAGPIALGGQLLDEGGDLRWGAAGALFLLATGGMSPAP